MPELDVLRRLGDEVVPPPLESLRATARRRDRRSSAAVLAAAAVAVVAVVVTSAVLAPDDDPRPSPIEPPRTEQTPSRPVTYADGATIHYGDRTVDAGGRVDELDLTDEGVAYRTSDGRIWFTDGSTTDEIGALGKPVAPSGDLESWIWGSRFTDVRSAGWIVSGNSGSLLSWFDFTGSGTPEAVVYDTATRTVALRSGVDTDPGAGWRRTRCRRTPSTSSATPTPRPTTRCRRCGSTWPQESWHPSRPTTTLRRSPAAPLGRSGSATPNAASSSTRSPRGPGTSSTCSGAGCGRWGCSRSRSRDGLTGEQLAIRAPGGYPNTNPAWLVQWLDDASVVIFDPQGDQDRLLVCPVPSGTCDLAVTRAGSLVVPDAWWR